MLLLAIVQYHHLWQQKHTSNLCCTKAHSTTAQPSFGVLVGYPCKQKVKHAWSMAADQHAADCMARADDEVSQLNYDVTAKLTELQVTVNHDEAEYKVVMTRWLSVNN